MILYGLLSIVILLWLGTLINSYLKIPKDRPPLLNYFLLGDLGRFFVMLVNNYRLYDWILETTKYYNAWTWMYSIPLYPCIYIVLHPDDVKHILKDNFWAYEKGAVVHDALEQFLGFGIFTVDGDMWKRQRQASSHLFKQRLLRNAVRVFMKKGDTIMQVLESVPADQKDGIDMQKLFHNFTMESFVEIAFGASLSHEEVDEFGRNFDEVSELIQTRTTNPFWKYLPKGAVTKRVDTIDRFVYRIIMEREEESAAERAEEEDIISRFLAIEDDAGGLDFKDPKTIRDVVINFILAGRDTTAQLLTWSIYLLSKHPECQDKIVEEAKSIIGDDEPGIENSKALKYTKACLDEALRLYPPVAIDFKTAVQDDVLPHSKVKINKGHMILWSAYVMGRYDKLWDDPERFDPQRWLGDEPVSPYKAIPFQTGPRICLGRNFAYLEATIMVVRLMRRFKFSCASNEKPVVKVGVTLRARDGIKVLVEKRET